MCGNAQSGCDRNGPTFLLLPKSLAGRGLHAGQALGPATRARNNIFTLRFSRAPAALRAHVDAADRLSSMPVAGGRIRL